MSASARNQWIGGGVAVEAGAAAESGLERPISRIGQPIGLMGKVEHGICVVTQVNVLTGDFLN